MAVRLAMVAHVAGSSYEFLTLPTTEKTQEIR